MCSVALLADSVTKGWWTFGANGETQNKYLVLVFYLNSSTVLTEFSLILPVKRPSGTDRYPTVLI